MVTEWLSADALMRFVDWRGDLRDDRHLKDDRQ